jgi:uncharacterized protein (DUF433 family)
MKSAETENPTEAAAEIVDRGDGPKVKGTRITVYAILEHLIAGWDRQRIAVMFNITEEQVQAAIDYIDANELEVLRTYVKILERIQYGNGPELQAKLDARHAQFQELVKEIRAVEARSKAEIHELIRTYPGTQRRP